MTENERVDHWFRKIYEVLHLHFRHYLPQGKPEPIYYREVFYELYKIYDSGALDVLGEEPIEEETVKQLDMFETLTNSPNNGNGTLFDQEKVKKP